ncbi:response regulator [Parachitinimonas caeni]|uniref:Response regulator n=1 Tax=Parachitinimonas caeni TaxID=3031301 RepID=A0ABT7DXP8_9NEIS|nr:response regulator [Parachitinimonas caeni]MDK2124851.1 response regulator [Parachitinimonas caeni]
MTQRGTLLLVDDEPFNLEILAEHLTDAGYQIDTAEDGQAAWDLLSASTGRYDTVLLDRMMPRMNGMEVLKRIKQHPDLQYMPVVLQTAVGSPDAVREGMQAGAYYYLTKPFEREMLLAITAAAVGDNRARRAVREQMAVQLDGLRYVSHAGFRIHNLDDAHRLTALIAQLYPNPERVAMGLAELMVNAVEHGNLGIGYREKAELMQSGRWREEVDRLASLPENAGKFVEIELERNESEIIVTICDQGEGFDWSRFLDFDPSRAFDPNGRGVFMARTMSFDRLEFQGRGNIVMAAVKLNF